MDLGRTGLSVSRLGFGCSQINSMSSRHSHREIRATVLAAVERGVNLFDTADVYGQGDSERMLGRLLASRQRDVVVCTKVGQTVGSLQPLVRFAKPVLRRLLAVRKSHRKDVANARQMAERKCFQPEYLLARLAKSLVRLRVESADIVMLHSPPPAVIVEGGALQALVDARDRGMARVIGVSVDGAAGLESALGRPETQVVQVPYHRFKRIGDRSVAGDCRGPRNRGNRARTICRG